MNAPAFTAVVMAGGQGQRFWPLSTADRPKRFLDLERSGRTLLQATVDRLLPLTGGVVQVAIRELAELVCKTVGYEGELAFDASKPDGTPRKLMDVSRLAGLGWRATTSLEDGVARTVDWYLAQRRAA